MKEIGKEVFILVCAFSLLGTAGCENLPGTSRQQGAVAGGVGGAAVGAAVAGEENRLLGAIIGGAVGTGGGYLAGAQVDKVKARDRQSAEEAIQQSQTDPATAEDARAAETADMNSDGFVTLDEVVALKEAGFSESEMIERLRATEQIFELTASQQTYLRDHGISERVINTMQTLNASEKEELLDQGDEVISREPENR